MRPEDMALEFDDADELPVYVPQPFPLVAWWRSLDPTERILYRGLGLTAAGLGAIYWPLAFIVPGAVLAVLALIFAIVPVIRGSTGA